MSEPMKDYYAKRAETYDEIYRRADSVRQQELEVVAQVLDREMSGKSVLEVACGTGYWTEVISKVARQVTATDANESMLDEARKRDYAGPVSFHIEDAYALSFPENIFDGAVANFWFSHVPTDRREDFLRGFHKPLQGRAQVFMADDVYREGAGGEFLSKPDDPNTYKRRTLPNGTQFEIVKNYPSKDDLIKIFSPLDKNFTEKNVFYGNCFWFVSYQLNPRV